MRRTIRIDGLTKKQTEHLDENNGTLHYVHPTDKAACRTCTYLIARALDVLGAVLQDCNNAALDARVQAYPAVIEAKVKFAKTCDEHGLRILRSALEEAERTVAGIAVYGPTRFYGSGQDVACDVAKSVAFIAGNLNLKALVEAGSRFDAVLEAATRDARRLTPADDGAVRQSAYGYRDGRWY